MHIRSFLAVAGLALPSHLIAAPGQENLAVFRVGPVNPSTAALTLHTDGHFYGTTLNGGAGGVGTVFRLTADGTIDWKSFSGNNGGMPGSSPSAPLTPSSDGWLWGSTQMGGYQGHGTVFRYKPETGAHQSVFNFMNGSALHVPGKTPGTGLSRDDSGWLWGCTPAGSFPSGGNDGDGIIFKVHEATGIAETVIGNPTLKWTNGNAPIKGRNPHSVYAAPGTNYVWGMTSSGGSGGNASRGTVFRIDRSTSPIGFITVGEFYLSNPSGGAIQAEGPTGVLTPDGLGYLWAATQTGNSAFGALIKVDMAGTTAAATTAPIQFTGTTGAVLGDNPLGNLVKDASGLLWGATRNGGAGDKGTVFKVDPATNTLTTVVQFGSLTGPLAAVTNPVNALALDASGHAWGLAQAATNGAWSFYKVNLATGALSLVKTFPGSELTPDGRAPTSPLTGKANEPWLYGTTNTGGQFNFGTLYRYNITTKALETLVHFSGQTGAALGASPESRLHIHTDGTVWGVTRYGGTVSSGFGTVFKYDPATSTFTHLISFTGNSGSYQGAQPLGKLATGGDGSIWGTTSVGNDGSIFKINPTSNQVSIIKTLSTTNRAEGTRADGGLVADSNGILWGMCSRGGDLSSSSSGQGLIYKINPVTGVYTVVVAFTGTSGAFPGSAPTGDPVFDAEGKLWGRFNNGAFKYDTVTGVMTTVPVTAIDTYPPELAIAGNYYRHSDGLLYGVLTNGGINPDGSAAGGGILFRMVEGYPSASASSPGNDVHPSVVSLGGGANLNGGSGTYQFEWGTSTALGQLTPALTSPAAFTANLALAGQTVYYFRSRVNGPNGPVYSPLLSFVTRQIGALAGQSKISVESPLGVPLVDNTSIVNVGSLPVGTQAKRGVIVRNIGQSTLTGLTATLSGADAAKFAITTLPVTQLPGMSANSPAVAPSSSVFVTYSPDAEGTHNAVLTITSHDNDSPSFEVLLRGSGVVDPDIQVEQQPSGTVLASNGSSTLDFGSSEAGSAASNITLAVKNTGPGSLTSVSTSLSGPHAADFSIVTAPASTIASNGSSNLVIGFTPSVSGVRTALLTITSNDPDEGSYQIALTGTGTGNPEIVFEYPAGTNVNSGGAVAFGTTPQGVGLTRTFTLRNTGNAPLTVSAAIQGQPQYVITTPPPGTIAAGATATFQVTLTPSSVLPVNATMRLTTNDPDEGTFDVILNGSGAPATNPELVVEQPASTNLNAGATVSYGSVNVGSSSALTFTVRNTGNAALTLSAAMIGASDYTVTTAPASSVAANGSTTFVVTLSPSAAGTRTGTLRLTTNDLDESIFDLFLTASAAIGQNPAFPPAGQPSSRIVLAGNTTHFLPVVTGGEPRTYQWRKNGGNLPGAAAKLLNLSLANVKASDAGGYSLVVSNDTPPSATSPVFFLGVITPLPASLQVNEGGTLTLACTASSPTGHTISYQWTRNGSPILNNASATTKTLKITGVDAGDAGSYACTVSMKAGTAEAFSGTSNGCAVTVLTKPVLSGIATPAPMLVSETVNVSPLSTVGDVPATFAAKGLPPGVKLDPNTGVFSGKPTAAKSYTVIFTAKNAAGTSAAVTVTWVVESLADEGLVGTFNGLVERDGFTNFGLGGTIQVTTTATGAVSGSVVLGGAKYALTGTLDTSSGDDTSATLTAKRNATLGNLVVDINIENNANRMTGEIRDEQFAEIASEKAGGNGTPGFLNGSLPNAVFNAPRGIVIVPGNGGYIADSGNHIIRHISDNGMVSTFAGTQGTAGSTNDTGIAASFNGPEGLARDAAGNLYVADTGNRLIRKITPAGLVSTLAGSGADGSANGTGTAASFSAPCALALDPAGNLIVVDRGNHTLRKITPAGVVTLFAGKAGTSGHKDGGATAALFNSPRGITYDAVLKAFFVTDTANRVIRKVTATGAVTTYAGSPGLSEASDGILGNARFVEPVGITSNGAGTLYVSDTLLVQITRGGIVGTLTEHLDEVNGTDHPVALGYDSVDQVVIALDDVLHGVASHRGTQPAEGASFTAWRNTWTTTAPVAPALVANYTAGITTTESSIGFPQGDGYATLSISKTGAAKWAGKAGDGTAFTFATVLSPNKDVMLHAMLYKNTGSLQGLVSVNETTGDLNSVTGPDAPAFDWYKLSQPLVSKDRLYKEGFITHPLTLIGGKFAVANHLYNFLDATSPPSLDFTILTSSVSFPLIITAPNTVKLPPPPSGQSLSLKITATTGLYSGVLAGGASSPKYSYAGVLVSNITSSIRRGYGHIVAPTSSSATAPIITGTARIERD